MKSPELLEAIDDFNLHFLKQHSEQYKNVKIVDINTFYQSHSIPFVDWRFFFTAQMVINPKLDKPFKKWFEKQMEALDLKRKKCIVLDCDNTLWGGVVGEDGTFGIKLGMDYPGNCFKRFQHLLLSLSKKGVILAICSKNNLKDVNKKTILTKKIDAGKYYLFTFNEMVHLLDEFNSSDNEVDLNVDDDGFEDEVARADELPRLRRSGGFHDAGHGEPLLTGDLR